MLDDGTSAIGVYAVYSSSNVPVRLLILNSNYFDGTGTRASTSVSLTGLTAGNKKAKRLTAPNATSRSDQGAAVTIGGSTSFTSTCVRSGTQNLEDVNVSGGAATVTLQASEALIVYL